MPPSSLSLSLSSFIYANTGLLKMDAIQLSLSLPLALSLFIHRTISLSLSLSLVLSLSLHRGLLTNGCHAVVLLGLAECVVVLRNDTRVSSAVLFCLGVVYV